MKITKALKSSLVILILCVIIILVVLCLPITQSLKETVIAEVIGGGVLGVIVSGVFFYLEESNEYQASKDKAKSFYKNKLLLDVSDVKQRGPSIWNLSGYNKFYFDGSHINPLFDVYQDNFNSITDYNAYFPTDKLTTIYGELYKQVRKGYIVGERLENLIRQFVRAEHHKANMIAANDNRMVMYLKAKLFANISDDELKKHLEWKEIPNRANEFLAILSKDDNINSVVNELREIRTTLMDLEKEIFDLI